MNALPRKNVTIANGDCYENVDFLGNHAFLGVVEGQIVACKDLQLKSWKGSRTCTATLLSYISLDPDAAVGTVAEPSTGESSHKKATMSKDCPRLTTLLVRDAATKMKQEYEQNPLGPLPTASFTVRGKVAAFTMGSFGGCPTFEKNGIAEFRILADVSGHDAGRPGRDQHGGDAECHLRRKAREEEEGPAVSVAATGCGSAIWRSCRGRC